MNLSTILAAIQAVNALLPEVISLLQSLEKAFPNASFDSKVDEVIKVLNSFSTLESELSSPITLITNLIKSFTPSSTPAPAPAA